MNVQHIGCADRNFRRGRPSHLRVEAVVIHLIDGSLQSADGSFLDNTLPGPRSAHYAVGRAGEIHRYVLEEDTAFHCRPHRRADLARFEARARRRLHQSELLHDWHRARGPRRRRLAGRHVCRQRRAVARHRLASSRPAAAVATQRGPASRDPGDQIVPRSRDGRRTTHCARDGPARRRSASAAHAIDLNVRSGSPSTKAPIVRVIPAGEAVNVVRQVSGESVNGISRWFQNVDDDFLWGGALEEPAT